MLYVRFCSVKAKAVYVEPTNMSAAERLANYAAMHSSTLVAVATAAAALLGIVVGLGMRRARESAT